MDNSKTAILKTLLYADIFNYPLTRDEIWNYLISNKKIDRLLFNKNFRNNKKIKRKDGYYFLSRSLIVLIRKARKIESRKKFKIARKYAKLISVIPTIKLIGVSGSLAMDNAVRADDIDFFIICSKNMIWTTRFFIILALLLKGKYRQKNDTDVADKICINLIVSEDNISLKDKDRNLFTSHEVLQMKPLFQREGMYKKFIDSNNWTTEFLPNFNSQKVIYKEKNNFKKIINNTLIKLLTISKIENFAKKIQKIYMGKSKTSVSDKYLAFYPNDYQDEILKVYKQNLRNMI